jgi:hypothetical protein
MGNPKFEYKIINKSTISFRARTEDIEIEFTTLGKEGWDLIKVVEAEYLLFIFKRQITSDYEKQNG